MVSGARRWYHLLHMIFGLLILLGVVAWGILWGSGDKWRHFVDLLAAVWVVGIITGGLWLTFGPVVVFRAFAALFSTERIIIREAYAIYLVMFTRAYQLAWGAGLVGMLGNVILMLVNMDDPAKIGPGLAASCTILLYAGFLAEFIFAPLRQVLANRAIEYGLELPVPVAPYRSVVGIGTSVAFALVAVIIILVVTNLPP